MWTSALATRAELRRWIFFMAHAAPDVQWSEQDIDAARGILDLCSGLPIALSVTGEAVFLLVSNGFSFEYACETCLEELSDEMHPGASILEAAIRVSLSSLERDLGKGPFSIAELYTSLCVLHNQQVTPVLVLARMWNVTEAVERNICVMFSSMSLARTSSQKLETERRNADWAFMIYISTTVVIMPMKPV